MDIEAGVKGLLESWGFSVEKIPESDSKTPDFAVRDDVHSYIVELKTRSENAETAKLRDRTLASGSIFEDHLSLIRSNKISRIIHGATNQLEAHTHHPNSFKIVWLLAVDNAQEAKCRQFTAAIYGTTQIIDLDGDQFHRPCYFFRDSDFYRYRAVLDAAIVSSLTSAKICLNPFSSRIGELRSTKLVRHFGSSICDPTEEELAGEAYFVDSGMDRANEESVMGYLRNKYGKPKLSNIDLGWHSASILEKFGL